MASKPCLHNPPGIPGVGGDRGLLLGRCERQEGDVARPFDGNGHLPLVLGTVTGDPPGNDFSTFGDKEAENSRVLVIDGQFLVGTESTDFSSQEGSFLAIPSGPFARSLHYLPLFSPWVSSPFIMRRSVAIISRRLRFFPSGVCQRRCFK